MFAMRLLLALLSMVVLYAQEKQAPEKQTKAPPPPPTNLKVLKATTGQEVGQIMRTFTVGLGVQCVYCHVQGNFPSDENPKKDIARHMITMTQTINGNFSEGKLRVSCYTCHRGEPEPKTAPEPRAGR
jgi:photosynthetic reaction center cytochrome c subunit